MPIDRALKNAQVIVHNGGIGTVAAAIQCGVPQIIVPRWFDQPRNAEWVRRLGAGEVIPPHRCTPETLSRQIVRLKAATRYRARSLELSSRIDSTADASRIGEFLESLVIAKEAPVRDASPNAPH